MEEKTIISGEKIKTYKLFIVPLIPLLTVLFLITANAFECRSEIRTRYSYIGYYSYENGTYTDTADLFHIITFEPANDSSVGAHYIIPIFFWLSILLLIIALIFILS